MGNYIVTKPAFADVNEILIYIAEDNLDAALTLSDRFVEIFELLAENPKFGRKRREFTPDARSFSEGNYLIVYRILINGNVEVLRVLHGARDLDEIFDGRYSVIEL